VPVGLVTARAAAGLSAFVVVVGGITAATEAGLLSAGALASSPDRIAGDRFWLLFTNGLVCDKPVAASLVGLGLFGIVVLVVCGARVAWTAGLLGHVFATLFVYALVALTRLVDPGAFANVLSARDLGVSAICAAWLGAVAATLWRRPARTGTGKAAIAAGCLLIGFLAWLVNPDLTVLDTDHLFAFPIGAAVALVPVRALVRADAVGAAASSAAGRLRLELAAFVRLLRSRPASGRR
jgi:hypothetical protein